MDVSGNIPEVVPDVGNNVGEAFSNESDTKEVCELLLQLLEEEQKNNETVNQINEILLLQYETYLQNYKEVMEKYEMLQETMTEKTEEREEETEENIVEAQLSAMGKTMEQLDITVSGNNAFLSDINKTAETLMETYTEQTEALQQKEDYQVSLALACVFVGAVMLGCILGGVIWKMLK